MKVNNKSRLFVKSKNIKNIAIPFLFIFTFLLVLFNKADYFLVNKMKSTSIDVVNPISKVIFYPIRLSINTIDQINDLRLVEKENIKLKEEVIRLKKWQRLALINIISAILMGSIAGSAMASASAMGSILGPEMEKQGYCRKT